MQRWGFGRQELADCLLARGNFNAKIAAHAFRNLQSRLIEDLFVIDVLLLNQFLDQLEHTLALFIS